MYTKQSGGVMTIDVYVNKIFAQSFNTVELAKKFIQDHDRAVHAHVNDVDTFQSPEYQFVERTFA
jgi:hypothetical protein